MTRLIMNADDFGIAEGVNLGIIKSYQEGILRSTTLMTVMPFAQQAATLMVENPGLGVGLHLTLSAGAPLLKTHKTIVDEKGNFLGQHQYLSGNASVDALEVEAEYQAQMDKFIELTGKLPTHIDHHHSYQLFEQQTILISNLAKKYDLPVRAGNSLDPERYGFESVVFSGEFYQDAVNIDFFLEDKANILSYDTIEFMSHPGFVDYRLYSISSYNINRAKEMAVLTHPKVINWIKENNVELINYTAIEKTLKDS